MTRDRLIQIIKDVLMQHDERDDLILLNYHNDINDWEVDGVICIDNIADAIMKEISNG